MTLTCFASAETVKHERVYAVTNAAGDALTVIDNVRLENCLLYTSDAADD